MTRFAKRINSESNPAYNRIFAMFDQPGVISLGDGVPDASTFPAAELEKMTSEVFEDFKKICKKWVAIKATHPIKMEFSKLLLHRLYFWSFLRQAHHYVVP